MTPIAMRGALARAPAVLRRAAGVGGIALALFVCVAACATNPVTGGSDLVFMSEDQELEIGRRMHPDMLKRFGGKYDDPELLAYITALGDRLADKSHRSHLFYHFTLIDSPTVNAFAMPGGYVYVTRGILALMNSETDLAGVLGHEIGHITARHGVRQHTKSTLAQIFAIAVAQATNTRQWVELANFLSLAVIRGYGREYELEADRLGAEYLARIGRDPRTMLDTIGLLKDHEAFEKQLAEEQDRKPRAYHGLFATHPKNDKRLQEVIEAARARVPDAGGAPKEDPAAFVKRLDGLVYGAPEKYGVVRDGRFYHKELGLSFALPAEWLALPGEVLRAHNVQGSVLLEFFARDLNRKETAHEYLARQLRKRLEGEVEALDSGGLPGGATARAKLNTPYGPRIARLGAVVRGKQVFHFILSTKDQEDFEAREPLLYDAAASLRKLTAADRDKAAARRLRATQVKPGETIRDLAARAAFPDHAEDRLRLINGLYPDGEPRAGDWVKLVE